MEQQRAKETACILALRRGVGLFSKGCGIYGVYANGFVFPVCRSHHVADLWIKAAQVFLREGDKYDSRTPAFRVHTPSGTYEADSWAQLLWSWLRGRRVEINEPFEGGG